MTNKKTVSKNPDLVATEALTDQIKKEEQLENAKKEYPFATLSCVLPSKGKVYPAGHAFHNKEVIDIKYLTAKEEDILTSPQLLRTGQAINRVVQSCVLDNVDVNSLLVGDRNAILLALRISGYGAEYKVQLNSADTGKQFEHSFDLNDCGIKFLEANPVIPNSNIFEYMLPQTKQTIHFKLMTVGEESTLNKLLEKTSKMYNQDKNVTVRLEQQIVNVGGNDDAMYRRTFVENMPVADSRAYRDNYSKLQPDTDMNVWITDPTSGEEVEVDIPIGPNFLWPTSEG
tara:strand:+ start:1371 stop:2228 length:858 start_codon:yes stop_codon:yes gene_type:complete